MLAQRGEVDVVVDERRHVVVGREPARDREAVPAGQHALGDRLAAADGDRRRHADADAPDLADRDAGVAQQRREARVHGVQTGRRRQREIEFEALLDKRRARQVADRRAAQTSVDIGHKHNAS